jgi:tetratricopeptide (TPR) repeat protein
MHFVLAVALRQQGDRAGAIASYRRGLELDPSDTRGHYNLGNLLLAQKDLAGAADCYRRAVALDPNHAEAHCNLGHALRDQGEFRAALAAFRTGHELGSQRKEWNYPSAQWIKQCERYLQLDSLLPVIRKGEAQPASAAERIELADLCRYRKLHVTSLRFFTEAFTADAKLAADIRAGHRYRAAGSAALAGCGQGEEADRLDEEERVRLRQQALEWLRADLAGWADRLETGTPQNRKEAQAALRYWQNDPALAGVRDADQLARLPSDERAAWQQLWADVAALLTKGVETK